MSGAKDPRPSALTIAALTRRLFALANVFALAIWGTLLVSAYGTSAFALLLPMPIVAGVVNVHLAKRGGPTLSHVPTELLRTVFNLSLHITVTLLCDWSLPSMLWIPFIVGISTPLGAKRQSWAAMVTLGVFSLVGALTGAPAALAAFVGTGLFLHLLLLEHQRFSAALLRDNQQAHRDLEVAQRMAIAQEKLASIGQIAAGVAHEINNPMCFVTANLEDLLEELRAAPTLPTALAEYRDDVLPETVAGVARVNSIVDDLRRFARGEPERAVSFDLSQEIRAAVRMARTQLRSGHQLTVAPLPPIPMCGMPRQLCQVVLNLLVNGLQALGPRGEVHVGAAVEDGAVRLTVTDDGAGMSEETRLHLFEPFYTTKEIHGTGLGLAVVRSIIQAHRGAIEVESAPDRGTTFHLTLPLTPASLPLPQKVEERPGDGPGPLGPDPLSAPRGGAPADPAPAPPLLALLLGRGAPSA